MGNRSGLSTVGLIASVVVVSFVLVGAQSYFEDADDAPPPPPPARDERVYPPVVVSGAPSPKATTAPRRTQDAFVDEVDPRPAPPRLLAEPRTPPRERSPEPAPVKPRAGAAPSSPSPEPPAESPPAETERWPDQCIERIPEPLPPEPEVRSSSRPAARPKPRPEGPFGSGTVVTITRIPDLTTFPLRPPPPSAQDGNAPPSARPAPPLFTHDPYCLQCHPPAYQPTPVNPHHDHKHCCPGQPDGDGDANAAGGPGSSSPPPPPPAGIRLR